MNANAKKGKKGKKKKGNYHFLFVRRLDGWMGGIVGYLT